MTDLADVRRFLAEADRRNEAAFSADTGDPNADNGLRCASLNDVPELIRALRSVLDVLEADQRAREQVSRNLPRSRLSEPAIARDMREALIRTLDQAIGAER